MNTRSGRSPFKHADELFSKAHRKRCPGVEVPNASHAISDYSGNIWTLSCAETDGQLCIIADERVILVDEGPEVLAYKMEASKKKWRPVDVAARLNALPLPYDLEKKQVLLLCWIHAGFVKMIAAKKTAYKENAYLFAATLLP